MNINELVKEAHDNAAKHGLLDGPGAVKETLFWAAQETFEAISEHQDGRMETVFVPEDMEHKTVKPVGLPTEMADVIICIASLAGHLGIDLEKEIVNKMRYNATRPYRHGGKT